jgi:RimJ/RimL family protein N-acetyltransferase
MPYRDDIAVRSAVLPAANGAIGTDWRSGLPVLTGEYVTLRELRLTDAPSLLAMLSTDEVSRFISPPPTTVEGFERFIAWTLRQRAEGAYACFAVTIKGFDTAIGIIQVRASACDFSIAEWGFAIGSPFWGTGVFADAAGQMLGFFFETLGTERLEARASIENGRGQGALQKIGAVKEAVLRKSFRRFDETFDQALYAILRDEWRCGRRCSADRVTVN